MRFVTTRRAICIHFQYVPERLFSAPGTSPFPRRCVPGPPSIAAQTLPCSTRLRERLAVRHPRRAFWQWLSLDDAVAMTCSCDFQRGEHRHAVLEQRPQRPRDCPNRFNFTTLPNTGAFNFHSPASARLPRSPESVLNKLFARMMSRRAATKNGGRKLADPINMRVGNGSFDARTR